MIVFCWCCCWSNRSVSPQKLIRATFACSLRLTLIFAIVMIELSFLQMRLCRGRRRSGSRRWRSRSPSAVHSLILPDPNTLTSCASRPPKMTSLIHRRQHLSHRSFGWVAWKRVPHCFSLFLLTYLPFIIICISLHLLELITRGFKLKWTQQCLYVRGHLISAGQYVFIVVAIWTCAINALQKTAWDAINENNFGWKQDDMTEMCFCVSVWK